MQDQVAICVATRRRPMMLADCLASLARLDRPQNYRMTVIVVENDTEPHSQVIARNAFVKTPDIRVDYVLETTVGIVRARNAAIEAALRSGATFIAFLDDDEQAERDWLTRLIKRQEETGAVLVGGPVRASIPADAPSMTLEQRLVFDGVDARYSRQATRACSRQRQGRESSIPISTNNWLCKSIVLTSFGIRFDERAGFGSGEDIRFYRAVRSHPELETAWAPGAWVAETIPLQRLTLKHQFQRSRAFTCDLHLMQSTEADRRSIFHLFRFATGKAVGMLVLMPLAVVRPGDAMVRLVWRLGAIAGAVAAYRKTFSASLYTSITGR